MKYVLFIVVFLVAASSYATEALGTACGEIQRLRTWAEGSDTYGVWIEYKSNPENCEGGFYIPHNSNNKELVFSMALAAKASGQKMCIQFRNLENKIEDRCVINYIRHE
ncbi:hypothetical protein [Microbulbifer epialgicus]|uniref:Uncharacterized protein n=1 Tax=Microbulbifer epialgicus TaxID=393907 RepID=A0ABV4P1D0_9GAMM